MTTEQIVTSAVGAVGTFALGGFGLWMRVMSRSVGETATKVATMHTALVGYNGDNGIVGDVRQLKQDVARHDRVLGAVVPHRRAEDTP